MEVWQQIILTVFSSVLASSDCGPISQKGLKKKTLKQKCWLVSHMTAYCFWVCIM